VMVGSLAALHGAAVLGRPPLEFLREQAVREQAEEAVAPVQARRESGSQPAAQPRGRSATC
jgi:hypothetical protein